MTKLLFSALCCFALTSCSSGSSTPDGSDEAGESTESGVPVELLGTWIRPCAVDEQDDQNTRYNINSLFFSNSEMNFEQEFFIDENCTVADESDPFLRVLGTGAFGESVLTTGGFEAREIDHIVSSIEFGDGSVESPTDLTSFNIYVIQDDVLYVTEGPNPVEEDRPDTITFDIGYIKQ